MMALIVFATGTAVSLAFFHLVRGIAGFTPDFDRQTLDRVGMGAALALYCATGPVLLTRALEHAVSQDAVRAVRTMLVLTFLILLWSFAIGVVAVESARVLL